MAKRVLIVIFDIEFPDDMTDSDYPYPGGYRSAVPANEIIKIIRDGCTAESFDYTQIISNSLYTISDAEMIFELEDQ
jgi:hypothetical protein